MPFGKGYNGGTNPILSNIVCGWTLSTVYTYVNGMPLALTGNSCTGSAGTCIPSYNQNFTGQLMPNGKWGKNVTY
jgi:hypothetical protein